MHGGLMAARCVCVCVRACVCESAGAALRQGEAASERRPLGERDRAQPQGGEHVPVVTIPARSFRPLESAAPLASVRRVARLYGVSYNL
jgi:hypothetical protein